VLDKPKGFYLSSFRCISAFVRDAVVAYDGPFPYIDGLVIQATQSIGQLEVVHLPRAEGRSNYNFRRLVRLWLSMFVNFSVMPLRLSTLTGFALSIMGLLGFAWVVAEAIIESTPPGWASLSAAVLLLSGVQLMILGLIGEYLGRLYLTLNRKPQAIVREIFRSEPEPRALPDRVVEPAITVRQV
jgi:undecaprenyl-phosphate 4-deoxy-4-formamido-L-arabinose transferase